MLQGVALVLGAALGFVSSRILRRPSHTASAASVVRNVGGALGGRRGLSLPELQRATFSEMMRHVRVDRSGRTAVPVRYLVHLHPMDARVVEDSPRFFTDGLTEALRTAATTHGWTMDGPVSIKVEAEEDRRQGAPAVLAVPPGAATSLAPAPPPDPAVAATAPPDPVPTRPASKSPRPMVLHRLDTGERIALTTEPVTIGRSADRDIVVDDSGVSRHHAIIRPHGAGWIITDGRSSNGTRLNGSALAANRPATLRAGDSIQVGPVRFRFDVDDRGGGPTEAPDGDDATGVLDDATRQRISGELRWPQGGSPGPSPRGDEPG